MSDEGQRAPKTVAECDQAVIGRQLDRSDLDEAIAWRDRYIAWQSEQLRCDGCTEEQIEAMARKALAMPYAFWIDAMLRRPARLPRRALAARPVCQPGTVAGNTARPGPLV